MEHEEMIDLIEGLGHWVYRKDSKSYNQERLSDLAEQEGFHYDSSLGLWKEID